MRHRVRMMEATAPGGRKVGDKRLLDAEQEAAVRKLIADKTPDQLKMPYALDEFKTHLGANSTVLRSKTPELILQELWGLLLAHFAIRQLMAQAVWPHAGSIPIA